MAPSLRTSSRLTTSASFSTTEEVSQTIYTEDGATQEDVSQAVRSNKRVRRVTPPPDVPPSGHKPLRKDHSAPSVKKQRTKGSNSFLIEDFPPRVDSKWKVGPHVSAAGGVENSILNAASIGANAFGLFLKSQRKWTSNPLTPTSISTFKSRMAEFGYSPDHVLPHGSYLINLGNPDKEKREKSFQCFLDDLKRCEQLGLKLYNFHPGSTVGQTTPDKSCTLIAQSINRAHKETSTVTIVLENMAGAGNIIGSTFEQLAQIIAQVEDKTRVGVCLDTCHMFAAGYDIRTEGGWNATMERFDRTIGFKYLRGMHLNDSKTGLGSKKDRHESIGLGELSLSAFSYILTDSRVQGIPLILETPSFELPSKPGSRVTQVGLEAWAKEVEVLNRISTSMAATKEGKASNCDTGGEMVQWTAEVKKVVDEVKGRKGEKEKATKGKGRGGKKPTKVKDEEEEDADGSGSDRDS